MKRSQVASEEIPTPCMEKVFTGRAVRRWQRLRGDAEEFPWLVTLPQPGLQPALPGVRGGTAVLVFHASNVAAPTSKGRKRFECVCIPWAGAFVRGGGAKHWSYWRSAEVRRWTPESALFPYKDKNLLPYSVLSPLTSLSGLSRGLMLLSSPSCTAEKEVFPCLQWQLLCSSSTQQEFWFI